MLSIALFPASALEHAPLEAVYIYFDTATYDEIERDEKVTSLTAIGSVSDIVKKGSPLIDLILKDLYA